MGHVKLTFKDNYAVIHLDRPPAHALDGAMMLELQETVNKIAESESVIGAILTAEGDIFCAGMDVFELYGLDQEELDRHWQTYARLLRDLVEFPKPLVGAINGHALNIGCIVALCCDYRILADGHHQIGINTVSVGIVPPRPVIEIAAHRLDHGRAARLLLSNAAFVPGDALRFGLVDEVCRANELELRAELRLQNYLDMPQTPWRHAKADLNRPLIDAMNIPMDRLVGDTVREWWSAESREAVKAVMERLRKKSA